MFVSCKKYNDLITFHLRERKRSDDRIEALEALIGIMALNVEYHRGLAEQYAKELAEKSRSGVQVVK